MSDVRLGGLNEFLMPDFSPARGALQGRCRRDIGRHRRGMGTVRERSKASSKEWVAAREEIVQKRN